ncbi:MAG: phenylalanine--tRNA ligase subunit beta [Alphaproteobacteria bacterium]|nr:phenylalanine--tRNA ligase subunit beta [Alphaproteobacteria bacterium]
MKFTLSWLKDHLETDAPLAEIAERLTMLGLEVEAIEDTAAAFAAFRVGEVISAERHPDADRLQVCMVDTGDGTVQVVCGAPNARAGLKGVFAPSGAHIPGTGIDLKKTKIRGVESNGMLLSEREIGLSDEHAGIIELPEDAVVGAPFAEIMGLDDPVVELAITPNRGDCLGVHGIARDLAAAGVGTLKPFDTATVPGTFKSPVQWRRDLPEDAGDACPLVVGRSFRGIKNGPSPRWLQDRLKAIGLRPISALVDITNYITFDLGRPLHVFDVDKIAGDLTMRFARPGETMDALDGRSYTLEDGMTVIADAKAVRAIGGIMGGEESGCTEETTSLFLEVAQFDPIRTAATGRKLGIESDARYRFERHVDPQSANWGAEVAARMILELCGGEASELTTAGTMPPLDRGASLRTERLAGFGGADIPAKEARGILDRLGFQTKATGKTIAVEVPSWRPDIEGEHCLIEEVLRIHGFDRIAAVPLPRESNLPPAVLDVSQRRAALAKRVLAGRGLVEAVTWSFMSSAQAVLFGAEDGILHLANPISADLDAMRPSVLGNLLAAAQRNGDRGYSDLGLFEVGPAWRDDTPDGQDRVAAGLRHGRTGDRHWDQPPRNVDAFDAKADALAVLGACGAPVDKLQITRDAPGHYHPGRSGVLRLGSNVMAYFGEIHPRVLRAMDVAGPASGCEVFVDHVPTPKGKAGRTRPALKASPFQPVTRDFAFLVANDVPSDDLVRAARSAEKSLITDVAVFDVFEGAALGDGVKSVAFSVTLQPISSTLTDAEIDAVAAKIRQNVEQRTGGRLRD